MEKTASILVVDDDESNRESLRRRLERRGYQVAVAVDGHDCLNRVQQQSFDLVILDVMMPGMNGLEALEILRRTHSPVQLPIIMATARDQSEDIATALDRGANDYVTKPLDFVIVSARVRTQLELKRSVDQVLELEAALEARNRQLSEANVQLTRAAERTARELEAASRVQHAFLPPRDPQFEGAEFSWIFLPCAELAGDSLNVVPLDDHTIGMYVLDVSGHGVASSLLAVTATRLLSPAPNGDSLVLQSGPGCNREAAQPRDVAVKLNSSFASELTEQFITLFYAVYNSRTRELTFMSAGHPGAILIRQDQSPLMLSGTGMPLGVGEEFDQQTVRLAPGDRVYLYSDGVTEAMDPQRELFGTKRLLDTLHAAAKLPLNQSVFKLNDEVRAWQAGTAASDDVSILAMECTA